MANYTAQQLIDAVLSGDLRAIARAITVCENHDPRARALQQQLFPKTGRAQVVGVTGAPGAGKSTLVDQLARAARRQGKKVAILAIDPTSPFSGGAILGDRIRMSVTAEDPSTYIRSMATRGSLGGLSRGTMDAVMILDAAGFDLIFIETVGVGQAEVDIVRTADTCVVVLVPGMGDSVQVFKAGIIEIADVFVVNKADRDGADLVQRDLRVLLSLSDPGADDWQPEVLRSVATSGEGADEIVAGLAKHAAWQRSSVRGRGKRRQILEHAIVRLATEMLLEKTVEAQREKLAGFVDQCVERSLDPYSAAERLVTGG